MRTIPESRIVEALPEEALRLTGPADGADEAQTGADSTHHPAPSALRAHDA